MKATFRMGKLIDKVLPLMQRMIKMMPEKEFDATH